MRRTTSSTNTRGCNHARNGIRCRRVLAKRVLFKTLAWQLGFCVSAPRVLALGHGFASSQGASTPLRSGNFIGEGAERSKSSTEPITPLFRPSRTAIS